MEKFHSPQLANAVAGANVSGAVSFATTANAVAGANVSGAVASATTATTATVAVNSSRSNQQHKYLVACSISSLEVSAGNAQAQVRGQCIWRWSQVCRNSNSVAGANVSGEVDFASTANSVAGANVVRYCSNCYNSNNSRHSNNCGTTKHYISWYTISIRCQWNYNSISM